MSRRNSKKRFAKTKLKTKRKNLSFRGGMRF